MCQYFFFVKSIFFECSRGKADQAAGEPVFCVINSAVFLWKILELISMAKRQNFSMQPGPLSHSAFKKHLLWIKKYHPRSLYIIFSTPPPANGDLYHMCVHTKYLWSRRIWKFYARERKRGRKNFWTSLQTCIKRIRGFSPAKTAGFLHKNVKRFFCPRWRGSA